MKQNYSEETTFCTIRLNLVNICISKLCGIQYVRDHSFLWFELIRLYTRRICINIKRWKGNNNWQLRHPELNLPMKYKPGLRSSFQEKDEGAVPHPLILYKLIIKRWPPNTAVNVVFLAPFSDNSGSSTMFLNALPFYCPPRFIKVMLYLDGEYFDVSRWLCKFIIHK